MWELKTKENGWKLYRDYKQLFIHGNQLNAFIAEEKIWYQLGYELHNQCPHWSNGGEKD